MIEFRDVSVAYAGRKNVLSGVSFSAAMGSVTCLIGPNGSGKTTLFRAAARQLPLSTGDILLAGRPIAGFGRKEYARTAAFLPQSRNLPAIRVRALVSHGRFPYLGPSRQLRREDRELVTQAMEKAGAIDWAGRDLRELSGGERQRVYLAMALAQDTPVIFLDEPTTYLDLRGQFDFLELIRGLAGQGKTIVMVLHDLAQALRYSDQVVLLSGGTLRFSGAPRALYESGLIEEIFGVAPHCGEGSYYFT